MTVRVLTPEEAREAGAQISRTLGAYRSKSREALRALLGSHEALRAALQTLHRFARPVDIQAALAQGGVDIEAILGSAGGASSESARDQTSTSIEEEK